MNHKKAYCFEIYRLDPPDAPIHEGLLRIQCFETSSLKEAVSILQEFIQTKYDFQTFWVQR
jgi:hypothetical protein